MYKALFIGLLILVNPACAQQDHPLQCEYANRVIVDIAIPQGGTLIEQSKGVDPYSDEPIYLYTIEFENQDSMTIEQKFCDMYNLSVTYKMKAVDQKRFDSTLNVVEQLTENVKQDYRLKAPLSAIVDMTMNQRNLSLERGFETGLPSQAAQSSQHVEHGVRFTKLSDADDYAAEVAFYFGIGGQ